MKFIFTFPVKYMRNFCFAQNSHALGSHKRIFFDFGI